MSEQNQPVALNFDASTVDPNAAFDPIPAGWYVAKITESFMKPTKAGTGAMLKLTFEVVDGEFTGRKIFTNLNLQNPNPVAVEIAYKDLSAICHATGRIQVGSSAELHNLPLMVKVKVKPADDNYDANNEIKGYKAVGQAQPAPVQQVAPAQSFAPIQPVQQVAPPLLDTPVVAPVVLAAPVASAQVVQTIPAAAQVVPPAAPTAGGATTPPWLQKQ